MSLLLALKSLYALNGFIAVLLYLPQIVKTWSDESHARSVSLLTFGGWCVGSLRVKNHPPASSNPTSLSAAHETPSRADAAQPIAGLGEGFGHLHLPGF